MLVIGGAADYSFVDEDARWRGSEVARATELLDKGTLDRSTVHPDHRGYLHAYERFKKECHFIPYPEGIEVKLQGDIDGELVTGRADRIGLLRGVEALGDLKTGEIPPATMLQTTLYGFLRDPTKWWLRFGVRLCPDGSYRFESWPRITWSTDLNTARAFVRVARWRRLHRLVRL